MAKSALALLAGLVGIAAATPAEAALGVPCANTDINPTAIDCRGFVQGNAVGGSTTTPSAATLLAELGYTGSLSGLALLEGLSGATSINFGRTLIGQTIIGVHYGNGVGSPGRPAGGGGDGDDTAFYLFDAGAGLNTITLNFNSSSNARLYSTGIRAVPEPGTWALMLLGFGFVGLQMRRRRTVMPQLA